MSERFRSRLFPDSLRVIAYYELWRNLRSFRFLVSSGLLTVLVALAVWVGLADYRLRVEAYEAKLQERDSSLVLGNVYSSLQPIVSKTPNPLAIFERGVDAQEGTEVRITLVEVPVEATGRNRGNPYLARLVGFDVTTVIKLVLGLGALLLTFDSMVGERSGRRVVALLAHGAGPSTILFGKVLAVLGTLVVSLTVALGPPVAWLFIVGALAFDLGEMARLMGVLLAYLAYGLTMALVGLAISLRASSVARSLVYATLAWLILVILLPLSLTAGVTAYADTKLDPLVVEKEAERLELVKRAELARIRALDPIRVTTSGHRSVSYSFGNNGAYLYRFGSPAYNDSMAAYFEEEVRLARLYAERIHWLRLRAQREARQWIRPLGWSAAVLPGQLLDLMAATMAGTTSADHDRFIEAAQMYRQIFLAYLEQKGAVGSWRWFTDDPPEGSPWTEFFGMRPGDVSRENIGEAVERWQDQEVQARVGVMVEKRQKDKTTFDVSDLPLFSPGPTGSLGRRLMATSASLIMIGILWLLVLDSSAQSRGLYPRAGHGLKSAGQRRHRLGAGIRALRRVMAELGIAFDQSIYWAELLGIVRQLRWRAAALLVVVMMMAGASIFALRYQTLVADQRLAMVDYEQRLSQTTLADLLEVEHLAQRPAWSLGYLIDGEERVKPSVYLLPLTTFFQSQLEHQPLDSQRLSTVPSPDWSFVLRVVLSLVAFFLGYDVLCGRRLTRFRIQMACGTPLWRIAVGKGFALWTALALPFVGGCGLGLLVLRLHGHPLPLGDDLLKLSAFVVIGLWGLMFYVLVTLLVSTWMGTAEKALVTLILLWITAVSVIPSAAGILVMRLEPLPPEWKLQADLKAIRVRAEQTEGAGDFRRLEWAKADGFAAEKKAAEIHRRRRAEQDGLSRSFIDRQLAQAELAEMLAYLSPMSLLQHGLQSLLGAGIYRQYSFVHQAQAFDRALASWARRQDALDEDSPHIYFFRKYFSHRPTDAQGVPRFRFEEPALAQGRQRAFLPLLLLALLTIALAALLPWVLQHRMANEKGSEE